MTDPATIAARLTKAQRKVVLKLGSAPRRGVDFSAATARTLCCPTVKRPNLIIRKITHDHGRKIAWFCLNAAGLATRTALLEMEAKNGR